MNISNINLKCDGTLPKGKFLECTCCKEISPPPWGV